MKDCYLHDIWTCGLFGRRASELKALKPSGRQVSRLQRNRPRTGVTPPSGKDRGFAEGDASTARPGWRRPEVEIRNPIRPSGEAKLFWGRFWVKEANWFVVFAFVLKIILG